MTRPKDLGHAVRRHYAEQAGDGRTRNNEAIGWGRQDGIRALAAQAEADPTLAAMLSLQQKHAIAQIKLTDAHRARQASEGDDAA